MTEEVSERQRVWTKWCGECDQPIVPPGAIKSPDEYDHAQGCPSAAPTPHPPPVATFDESDDGAVKAAFHAWNFSPTTDDERTFQKWADGFYADTADDLMLHAFFAAFHAGLQRGREGCNIETVRAQYRDLETQNARENAELRALVHEQIATMRKDGETIGELRAALTAKGVNE